MEKISRVLIVLLIVVGITACGAQGGPETEEGIPDQVGDDSAVGDDPAVGEAGIVKGITIPHHLLVERYMEQFYQEIASDEVERVILLSPNHFHYGHHFIQSSRWDMDVDTQALDFLKTRTPLAEEPKYFGLEHGVFVHLPFISNYFPKAKVLPIIFKKWTPKNQLDAVIQGILDLDLEKTIVIASVDFTHYESEENAVVDDEQTKAWFEEWEKTGNSASTLDEIIALAEGEDQVNPEVVAIDSPESIYVLLSLMEGLGARDYEFWKRTSSASLTGVMDPLQNTSHIFAKFKINE